MREALTPSSGWYLANQRALSAALQGLREALKQVVKSPAGESLHPIEWADLAQSDAGEMDPPPALEMLCVRFGLSPFERLLLLTCAGVELDAAFPSVLASAQGDPERTYPTFSLALACLPDAHWSALSPQAPLRHWRLIEVASGGITPLTLSPLRIDERVLNYLVGVQHLDERLAGLVYFYKDRTLGGALPASHQELAERVASLWAPPPQALPAVQLLGSDRLARRQVAAEACARFNFGLAILPGLSIPVEPRELEAFLRLWEREAALSQAGLMVECDEMESSDPLREAALQRIVEACGGLVMVSTRERQRITAGRPIVSLNIARPTPAEQRLAWQRALGGLAPAANGQVDHLVAQFSLSTTAIASANVEFHHSLNRALEGRQPDPSDLGQALWEACRRQARPRLDNLAQRIETQAIWDDLVLPEALLRVLHQISVAVRQRATVYEQWGFSDKTHRGLGISALFSGPSGTGKTLAAEILASELHLDLYRIDLSQVVSKYIGETEKNLRRVFDAAEDGGAVLLFDEADALFGKRSEVKDSHDRYANIEVSYLLQRMETYRGLAILTTNLKSALDAAFLRRIRFIVHFPFPDPAQRAEIWKRVFPAATPTSGLDAQRLAQLNVTGGSI
jgi:hypothetical protein